MQDRYRIEAFTDGAIPVYAVVDAESGHPFTNTDSMPWQSISPNLLRRMMWSIMPEAVEVQSDALTGSGATPH